MARFASVERSMTYIPSATRTPAQTLVTSHSDTVRLAVAALVIVLISELIGIVNIPLGIGKIVLLPMLWALLIGATWSLSEKRLPAPLQIGAALQRRAAAGVQRHDR